MDDQILGIMLGVLILIFIISIAFYVITGIVLLKLNRIIYGNGTPMAWIPCCNIYLLGKLTFNKWVGWILLIFGFISSSFRGEIVGNEIIVKTILPIEISPVIPTIYSIVIFLLFIYAIVKYIRLR